MQPDVSVYSFNWSWAMKGTIMDDTYGTCDVCSVPLDPTDVNYKARTGLIVCSLICAHKADQLEGRKSDQWVDNWEALEPWEESKCSS